MHDRTAIKGAPAGWGVSGNSREARLRRRFPTVEDLRRAAERRVPSLGYETVAGGAGQNRAVKRNADALDAIEMAPRTGADKGPVAIVSTQNIVAAERVIYRVNNTPTSFSEMMGLPQSQLNTTYWFPWYNNVDLFTEMRFAVP